MNIADVSITKAYGPKSAPEPRFKLVRFKDILLSTAPAYLVKGLVPAIGLIVIWGPPKCGKSFWTSDVGMHVALGWEYRGRKVKQGVVVYLVLEGDAGFKARAEAWRQRHLADNDADPPFFEIATRLDLVADHQQLIRDIRHQLPLGIKPALVVVDTVNRSMVGSESSDEDMGKYIKAADAIREAFDCAIAVVHHCGIEGTRPRGHTSLTGAADAQIAVQRDAAKNIVVTVERMKDGPEGDVISSTLDQVEVGYDEEGDVITSCVIEPVDGDLPVLVKAPRPKALPAAAKTALRALMEAIAESGEVPLTSNHIPANTKCVAIERWRDHAYRMGISASAEEKAKRVAFNRSSDTLLAETKIGIWDPFVWIV